MFEKHTCSRGADALKMEITPYRDWRIIVIAFFSGMAVALGFNIYMSKQISGDGFVTATSGATNMIKFDAAGLEKAITTINSKEALFEKVKNEGVATVDPSI